MKHFLRISIALLSCFVVKSQNYIPNPNFETPSGGNDDTRWPNNPAEVDKMASWESRTLRFPTGNTHHSPDWIHQRGSNSMSDFQATSTSPFPIGPESGQGMVGMFDYELIQTLFNQSSNPLDPETYHTLSLWIFIPSSANKNCKLKIMFAKNRFQYKSEHSDPSNNTESDVCTADYIDYKLLSSDYSTMCEFDIAALNLPVNSWQKVSATFKTPKNSILNDYDWFAVELRKNNYTGTGAVSASTCHDSYIFIDNLSLEKSSFCDAICAPSLNNIVVGTIPNALNQSNSWMFTVQNAISLEFAIYDRWGGLIDKEEAFDPNGLRDVGFSNYLFGWNTPGSGLAQDVYNYTLKIKNCSNTLDLPGIITIGGNGPPPTTGFNFLNFDLNDCCVFVKAISNVTYTADKLEAAKNLIMAGGNVGTPPNGPVVVKQGIKVKYVAKKVQTFAGFSVEKGGDFRIKLTEDCTYEQKRPGISDRMKGFENDSTSNKTLNSFSNAPLIGNDLNGAFSVFPNPSKGIFNFKSNSDIIVGVEIYNNLGQLITLSNKINKEYVVNLLDFKNGVFVYRVLMKDGTYKTGKLIKGE